MPLVGIVMGSAGDRPVMAAAEEQLTALGVDFETKILSAHRTPDAVREWVRGAPARGIKVFICGAGGAAHLAGAVAAHTTLPVIGVPLAATFGIAGGLDALLSTAQMPRGVPVATVAVGEAGAGNAGLLAAQILATADAALAQRIKDARAAMTAKITGG